MRTSVICLLLLTANGTKVYGSTCREIIQDAEVNNVAWTYLEKCLTELNSESMPNNVSENVWRLTKIAFDGIGNIPAEAYKKFGFLLTAIPKEDLFNISMEQVEIVEAFGAIHNTGGQSQGFDTTQMKLIGRKVRHEWLGKNPDTYSQYDLISMGEIVCHLNVTDIAAIHADAFKEAAEWIGKIENCPLDPLQAYAQLAMHEDAFGNPINWSKLDVSIMGNIINGLSFSEIASIDKDKLHLNRYFTQNNKQNDAIDGKSSKAMQNSNNVETNQDAENDSNVNKTI